MNKGVVHSCYDYWATAQPSNIRPLLLRQLFIYVLVASPKAKYRVGSRGPFFKKGTPTPSVFFGHHFWSRRASGAEVVDAKERVLLLPQGPPNQGGRQ